MVAIVIPTLNEEENIKLMIPSLLHVMPDAQIIVVDDSSIDRTQKIVEGFSEIHKNVHLLKRNGEKNFAKSYCEGFDVAFRLGATQVVQMDADFTHDPLLAPLLIQELSQCDLVIGSRYVRGGQFCISPLRRFFSAIGNSVARYSVRSRIQDLTSGFLAWRVPMLQRVLTMEGSSLTGYAFLVELKHRAEGNNALITEIPISAPDRIRGISKMDTHIVQEAIYYCIKRIAER